MRSSSSRREAPPTEARSQRSPSEREESPRRTPITTALVMINVAIFLLEERWGGSTTQRTLESMGAMLPPSADGFSPARLLAHGYLHIGALHLGMNMLALWSLGRALESVLGASRFFALYSLSLLGAGLAIGNFSAGATAGASGALYGLLGAACVRMFARYLGTRHADERQAIRGNIGAILIPNLLLSLLPGFSLSAHLGGLVAGAMFSLIAWDDKPSASLTWTIRLAAVSLAVATVASIASIWLPLQPWRLG